MTAPCNNDQTPLHWDPLLRNHALQKPSGGERMKDLAQQVEQCLARFRAGELTEADLLALLDTARRPLRQSLLYLQASSSHPYSRVIGISIYEEGADSEGVDEKGDFLYASIKEALEDGWRIIKFPEMALAMDDQNNYGLGYEFILERWR
jgi:hypothetical protein